MRGLCLGVAALALLVASAAAGCSYAPNVASGTLMCGTGSTCPEGYRCDAASNTCWKNGESPGAAVAPFLGHWLFGADGVRKVQCTDNNMSMSFPLATEYIDLTAGSPAPLAGFYYCTWQLDIGGGGNSTTIRSGQSCSGTASATGIMYTWHGMKFQFSLGTGGLTASLDASLPADFKKADNTTGTCSVQLSGTLTKAAN